MDWNASGVSSFAHHRRRFLSASLGLVAGIRMPIGSNGLVAASATAGDEGGHAAFHQAGELSGGAGPVGDIATAGSRSVLAAIPASAGAVRYLTEAGREGLFVFSDKDLSAKVASDALQGLYVAGASNSGGRRGAWVRQWDGITGNAEWFGAAADNRAFDNQPAIQAALDLLPHTQLRGGIYYTASRLRIMKNGTRLSGAGHTQTDQDALDAGYTTQITCTSATETILQLGSDSGTQPTTLLETVHLDSFTVNRSVNPFTAASGLLGCIGISMRWCVNCHAERVFSINSSQGWYLGGVVQGYLRYCGALREREGSNAANDTFVGFYLDSALPTTFNGGNASLALIYCRAFSVISGANPVLTYSTGIRLNGGWVDTYIDGFESGGGIQYGIHGIGTGYTVTDWRTENLRVHDCTFDPGAIACIRLEAAGPRAAITISNCYLATGSGTALHLFEIGGAVTIANNQFLVASVAGTGMSAGHVGHLRSEGNIFTGFEAPIALSFVSQFSIRDTIHGIHGASKAPAISANSCFRGKVDSVINGVPRAYGAGVNLQGAANHFIEVCATTINAPAIAGGANNKIVHNGSQITAAGAFGTNNLASGIMA